MKTIIRINDYNAEKIRTWIKDRGGVAVWNGVNLSNIREVLTPALDDSGKPYGKPAWDMPNNPSIIITDEKDIDVTYCEEVKRFHVAIRMGSQGFMMKCTDASSARINREIDRAGPGAYHQFDYDTQEAVIFAPLKVIPLMEYKP